MFIKKDTTRCVLCGNPIINKGFSANPVYDGECCEKCNTQIVMPERMRQILVTN